MKQTTHKSLSYTARSALCTNPVARELFAIMDRKESNLALSLDVTNKKDFLRIMKATAPHICLLKTHMDIIEDFDMDFLEQIQEIAEENDFLIFEDRKFADIGNTVQKQYSGGIYKIVDWAHIINAHIIPGPGIIQGLRKEGLPKGRALLLLAEMSSAGSLAHGAYTDAAVQMAREYSDFVIGFICQRKLVEEPQFIHMTPGVNLSSTGSTFGQQYNTPEIAITENGSDLIIVGTGIIQASNPEDVAEKYRQAGWQAHLARVE